MSSEEQLDAFARSAGDNCRGDVAMIHQICEFLKIRRITPSVSFDSYLQAMLHILAGDEADLSPEKQVKEALPRTKKAAEAAEVRQWSAAETKGYLLLYLDLVEAAQAADELPMTLGDFLASEVLRNAFLEGQFDEKKTADVEGSSTAPVSRAGQRCLYTHDSGRQERGVVLEIVEDLVTLRTDAGEELSGLSKESVSLCDDPPPNDPTTPDGESLPQLGRGVLQIPKAEYQQAKSRLDSPAPLGSVEMDTVIHDWAFSFSDGFSARLDVVNGEPNPYVDAYLSRDTKPEVSLADVPPRSELVGNYRFTLPGQGWYELEVRTRT